MGSGAPTQRSAQNVLSESYDSVAKAIRVLASQQGDPSYETISASASGNTEVIAAPGAGLKIRVVGYTYVVNAAVNVKFQRATTDVTGLHYHSAQGEGVSAHNPAGVFEGGDNQAININLSGAVAVGGEISYFTVDA